MINIPVNANEIIHTLQNNGFSAYVVGGCVRDSIMEREPHDWDICTSATPDEIIDVFKGRKIIGTGLKHGTVTIVINGEHYEVTTYRIDGKYSDNRRPDSVSFTDDLIEDLKRRDFTINAMAYNDENGLIDPFYGMDDITDMVIRCVGKPEDRFGEDALRILRALRFSCQLGFTIHPSIGWCIGYTNIAERLKSISAERICSELSKMMVCSNFYDRFLKYYKVFFFIIPELKPMIGFEQNNPFHQYDVFLHTYHALQNCEANDLTLRLSVLLHDVGKPHCFQEGEDGYRHFKGHSKESELIAKEILTNLRFDKETIDNVTQLIRYHDATFEATKKSVRRWLNRMGVKQFKKLLLVRQADIKGQQAVYDKKRIDELRSIRHLIDEVIRENECFSMKNLAINGDDVMRIADVSPGVMVGNILNCILQKVIDGELVNDRCLLLQHIKESYT